MDWHCVGRWDVSHFATPIPNRFGFICSSTDDFRGIASSVVAATDLVVEIGFSTGKCSRVICQKTKHYVGIDNSSVMKTHAIAACPAGTDLRVFDVLQCPQLLVRAVCDHRSEECQRQLYFVDIGTWHTVNEWLNFTCAYRH